MPLKRTVDFGGFFLTQRATVTVRMPLKTLLRVINIK
jgi:hypothetical protein